MDNNHKKCCGQLVQPLYFTEKVDSVSCSVVSDSLYQSLFLTGVKGEALVSGTKFSRFSETYLQGALPVEGLRLETGICHVSGSRQFKGK